MKRYPGGKNAEGTWQWAIGHMPSHAFYAELFAGSAGLYRRKVPAIRSVLCDRDSPIADYWRRHALPGTTVVRGCAIRWLMEHAAELGPEWLLYLEPPYLPETRVKKKLYRYEMTLADHKRLLAVVVDVASRSGARFMISGYPSKLYDEALIGWARHTREVMTRGRSWRTEVLWCNFQPGDDVDRRTPAAGRDWRERDRIKCRVASWAGKFRRMPAYERAAVLNALIAAEQLAARSPAATAKTPSLERRNRRGNVIEPVAIAPRRKRR